MMVGSTMGRRLVSGVSLPWDAFVAAFVYFTILTAIVIGGVDLSGAVMAVAYLLPLSLYVGVVASRAIHALGSIDMHFHHTPHALVR